MASKVQIFNMALNFIGDDTVISPGEDSEAARVMELRYADVRDAVLRAHPWNCATDLASVVKDTAAPAWGYANQFQLPADPFCLRVLRLQDDKDKIWEVLGRKILTDEGSPLNFRYIKQIENPEDFDPLLTQAIALRLANANAFRIVNSRTAVDTTWNLYQQVLAEARSVDAQEGTARASRIEADEFEQSRF